MDTKIPKLTEDIFIEILKNKNEQSVEIYKKINEWGLEQLTNKNTELEQIKTQRN